jgi:hypothetical protein
MSSSLEGLISLDGSMGSRAGSWISVGNKSQYRSDPYYSDGVYPNAVRISWTSQANGQSWGFYFWEDSSYSNGCFFRIGTSASYLVPTSQVFSLNTPQLDGSTRLFLGNIVNGVETVVVQRFVDQTPAISTVGFGQGDIIETADSSAGSAMLSVTKSVDGYVTSFFGPRFYTAFSFPSPQFSGLPRALTREATNFSFANLQALVTSSAVHNLGAHTIALPTGATSWVLSDNALGVPPRKPAGPERNEVRVVHLANNATGPEIPSQREAVGVASVGAYADTGPKVSPWGQAGESRVAATINIVPIVDPARPDVFGTFSMLLGIQSAISGGFSAGGVVNLGTRAYFKNEVETSSASIDRAPVLRPTFSAQPGVRLSDPVYIDLPAFDDLVSPGISREAYQSTLDFYATKLQELDALIQQWNSGEQAANLPASIERLDRRVSWAEQQRHGFLDLTPRLRYQATPQPQPLDFVRNTSEAVRQGQSVDYRIYASNAGGAWTRTVGLTENIETYTEQMYRQRIRKGSGSDRLRLSFTAQGVPIYATDTQGRDQWSIVWRELDSGSVNVGGPVERTVELINAAHDIELYVPEIPISSIRQLFASGSVTFTAPCEIIHWYWRELSNPQLPKNIRDNRFSNGVFTATVTITLA